MRVHTRFGARPWALAAALLVVAAGCQPEIDFDVDGRQSQIDRVVVTAELDVAGVVHVEQRYTFTSAEGGTVALPDLAKGVTFLPGASNITLDGEPVTPTEATFQTQLRIDQRTATVGWDLTGAVQRYQDIAVLDFDVLTAPDDASRQDPDVRLSGTLTLPDGAPGVIEPHLHGGRDRTVTVAGQVIGFSAQAAIWMPAQELEVALPSALQPYVNQIPTPFLSSFHLTQSIRDKADEITERTLGTIDKQSDLVRWILTGLAFGLPAIFWLLVVKVLLVRFRDRRRVVGDVPKELVDPPSAADPAVVAVLEGEGRPARTAVAGTVLAMAARKVVDIRAYGDRLVVKIPLTTTGENTSEQLVLNALRERATPEGVIEGPPVFGSSTGWFREYRRDAVKRARDEGMVTRWMPLAPLSGALTTTGVGIGIFFFTEPIMYTAIVMSVQVIAGVVSFVSGWTLTDAGWRNRALWHSFARYIRHQGKLDKDVGPAGVVIWGPYLVYGTVLGEAEGAARPLTP